MQKLKGLFVAIYTIILIYLIFRAYQAWETSLMTASLLLISLWLAGVITLSRILDLLFHENTEQETKIKIDYLKFPESIRKTDALNEPIDSDWSRNIRNRDKKSIKFCSVLFNGEILPWGNQKERAYSPLFIDIGGSANAHIPVRNKYPKNIEVIVKDGDEIIWKGTWEEIPCIPKP